MLHDMAHTIGANTTVKKIKKAMVVYMRAETLEAIVRNIAYESCLVTTITCLEYMRQYLHHVKSARLDRMMRSPDPCIFVTR
jgi:hypothetical protein